LFGPQLEQLADMGFEDQAMLLPLLQQHGGNMEAVVTAVFSAM
jgi:hypothetical protein